MKNSSKPIRDHILDFLEYCEVEKGLAPRSVENYQRFLKKFTEWLRNSGNGSLKPNELTGEHIWHYRLALVKQRSPRTSETLKKTTQAYYLIALRGLLAYFAERDIRSLPSDMIKLPKIPKERKIKFLTIPQVEKLLLAPDTSSKIGLRDRAILETLFST
ncbi:MAG: phage integrase N-terminal SAM-like domain-containing protein, partial [Parcubacteria group bacterium]|nr:phage integrase N-terminal SAM-like domain-containing protein [Parcubacteria group bacterium]